MAGFPQLSRPFLLPFCILYGLAIWIRNLLFDIHILPSRKFKLPVISLGNITVGGTGKTPLVEYLVRLLGDDYRIALLSRGYRRKTRNFVLADSTSGVSDIGDEPLQMKLKFPDVYVAVSHNRVLGIKILKKSIPKLDLVILDDAFQHRYVIPGLSILLIDYNRPVFNDFLLPAGNLREPARHSKRAQILIISKCPEHISLHERSDFIAQLKITSEQSVFFTTYRYETPVPVFPDKHGLHEPVPIHHFQKYHSAAMLVTGIANPGPFREFLQQNLFLADELSFPDHHAFTLKDIAHIRNRYSRVPQSRKCIIVTEKDAVRLRELNIPDREFRKSFYYLPIRVHFLAQGEKTFIKLIHRFLKKAQ
jgi:tetraacyldisaccharide 4'-kinase